jgi:DNA-binding transcriptional LysR family regulator
MVQRKLGELTMVSCASRRYLDRFGVPTRLDDLEGHQVVHYASALSPGAPELEYIAQGEARGWPMRASLTVNNTDAYTAACLAGVNERTA